MGRIAIAVLLAACRKMLEWTSQADLAQGMGGAPAGPPTAPWWLQPGLPAMSIDQLAPNIDIAKLLGDANQLAVSGCTMSFCALSPDSFTFDSDS
ncbi:MAG: hypothetical protein ABI867_26005 [Kofleriaceae bacterium]